MILSCYALETIITILWYVLIVKKEVQAKTNGENNILRRTIKLLIQYRVIVRNNILLKVNYRQEKRERIIMIKKHVIDLILVNVWIGSFFVMSPLITNFMIKDNVMSAILFIILVVILLVEQLKEHTQNYIEILERYIKQVLIPLEKYPKIIEIEDEEMVSIQWTTKNKKGILLAIIISISIIFLFILGERYLFQNRMVREIGTIFIVIYFIIEYNKNKIRKREKEKKEIIFVDIEYDLIKEEVENICNLLNIHNIRFGVVDENRINAYSRINENGVWEVWVTSLFITKLRKMHEENVHVTIDCMKKIFLVTVVHELGHVFYKDSILEERRMFLSALLSFGISIMAMCLLVISIKSKIFAILSIMLLLFDWIFAGIMSDRRYWGQIAELKADRIVTKYVDGGAEAFVRFWGNDERIQKEEKYTRNINKENFIYIYYKRNLEIEKHPSMKYRCKLMKERNEWKWWEYFKHVLVIQKWRWSGLGWNGVLKVTKI